MAIPPRCLCILQYNSFIRCCSWVYIETCLWIPCCCRWFLKNKALVELRIKSNATKKQPHSSIMGKASLNLFFLLSVWMWHSSLILKSVLCWARWLHVDALKYLCSISTVMICILWLVGVLRVGCWAEVKMSRYYSAVPLQLSWAVTSTFTFYTTIWCLNRHLIPLILSLWFICVSQNGHASRAAAHHFSHCTIHQWPLCSGALISEENCGKRKCLTNNQSKGKTEQQYDLIVHPLNPHRSWHT